MTLFALGEPALLHTSQPSSPLRLPRATADRSGIVLPHLVLLGIATAALAADFPLVAPGSGFASLMLFEVVTWTLFGIVLVNDLAHRRRDIASSGWNLLPQLFLYCIWCVVAVVLALGIKGASDTVGKLKNLLPGILLFMLMARMLHTRRQIVVVLVIFFLGILINAVFGIAQFLTGDFYLVPQVYNNVWKADIYGNFLSHTANGLTNTPNNLAALLVPGLVLGPVLLVSREIHRRPLLALSLLGFLGIVAVGMYFTFSKGGMIWSVLGIVVALVPLRPRWRLWFGLLVLLGGLTTILAFATGGSGGGDSVDVNTVSLRILLWDATGQAIANSTYAWWFGDSMEMVRHANATRAYWPLPTAHNTWLDQLVFFGSPALLLYLLLWWSAARRICAALGTAQGLDALLLRGLLGCLVAMAGILVFEPRADGVFQSAQIFFLMALGLCSARHVRAPAIPRPSHRWTRT
jgi:hypothetical protein